MTFSLGSCKYLSHSNNKSEGFIKLSDDPTEFPQVHCLCDVLSTIPNSLLVDVVLQLHHSLQLLMGESIVINSSVNTLGITLLANCQ